ncbi:hypothetical protein EDI_279910 [Entamoeba dispar SAW760]|uniref:SSD domain-containing protein n=1 Tax=Entamoeba dispar (strain ATCC PRA-260 / SAW760) TaxID=370354 RepID=B0EI48_ENTDS|nr:uncharacterized protein EDI_279910 [Entamoeba dispar SAW760]EDR25801.1 hypothetical protein EDI_279910 [Entamoeba dispar SAW760]|eukprot:EDR25801.1 hypothetical protein EDI_279910 [Entamoeba dispar SAW760]
MEETQQIQPNDSGHIEVKREERKGDKIFNFLFKYIHKLRFVIVIFWILAVIGFAYPALKFLGATSLFIEPPKGTLAYSANQLVNEKYPDVFKEGQNIVAIKTTDNSSVLTPYTESFSHQLNSWMQEQPIILSAEGYYLLPNASNATIIDQTALEIIKKQFVGKSGDVTTIIITIDDRDGTAIPKFVKSLRKEIKRLNNETDKYYVGVTGFEPGSVDLQEEIMMSLMKMDISCIPIAILVLLWVLKSLSLMIIPLCTIVTSFVVSFGIMYPITFAIDIYGVAPALMMSCIAAMSIDYSLFLLTRFSEELSIEQSYYDVIKNTLQHAGRIIFTSGGLLTLCFVSLCFFPLDVIITLGMGAAISIFITIIVNLTLTPSLLGIFPKFFSKRGFIPCIKRCRAWAENKEKSYHKSIGLYWCVPVITFPIIIGLSSDYDIFLFSRIMELRRKGLSTHLSVIIGVEKAGYLISYAGIIMAIAFSGLFLSAILMLNQFAFILMFSVLLDTFIIRSILLPAIVNLLGELNWFPKRYAIQFDNYKKYMDTISPEVSEETPIVHNTQNGSEEGNEKTALLTN